MSGHAPLSGLLARMEQLLQPMIESDDPRRYFLATYMRTTAAVAADLAAGRFADPEWTERWDLAFADLYLDALEQWNTARTAPGPWRVAFAGTPDGVRIPPVRHVLLGMNAHINFDLPQALLAMMDDTDFDDEGTIARRRADHEHIDTILAGRVKAEDLELRKVEERGDRTLLDSLLTPFNRRAARQFLAEARGKVWHNAFALNRARQEGTLQARLGELEELCARRVADLRAPGQVVLRLARHGFGVQLAPPATQ